MKIKRIALLPVAALAFGLTAMQFSDASAVVETSWGPQDRPTYTWEEPADHVTFNSIKDNPFLGDERNFVRVRELGTEEELDEVTIEPGKEYQISIYYHNDASASLNSSGKGISRNTYVRTEFPSYLNSGEIGAVVSFITASNAEPNEVWDTTYLKAGTSVSLSFVPNSAVIHNNGTTNGTVLSGDALTGEQGVTIGHYDNMWGMVPGCNEYGGYVTYNIRADAPAFEIDKKVSSASSPDNWQDEIVVTPGDMLNFQIYYHNTGTTEQTGVTAHDSLPNGLSYIEGSTYAKSSRHPEGSKSPEALFDDGLGLGAMIAGEEAFVTYNAKVVDDTNIFPCGDTEIYNSAYIATYDGQSSDKVKIIVRRDCGTTTTTSNVSKLPTTGPGEIAMALAVILIIGGGGFYFYQSRRMLKKVSSNGPDMSSNISFGSENNVESTDVNIEMKPEDKGIDTEIDVKTEMPEKPDSSNMSGINNKVDVDVNEDIVKDSIQNPKE